ncbi:MAG: hypothetical protein E7G37_06315, partial [Streptococcus sp.]|nr:hypothetical protein [Negativicoccus succinicivorans]MDU8953397.1 hypothetical protein [Streptococcus sp.]
LTNPDEVPVKPVVMHHEVNLTAISPHGVHLEGSGPVAPGVGGVTKRLTLPYPLLMMLPAMLVSPAGSP